MITPGTTTVTRPVVLPRLNTLQAGRILPIDAFRGLTFLIMVWVNELHGVSGISPWWKHMPADADAMSFVDAVFPAFLFIVGMSIPFAIHARIAKGDGWAALQGHIAWRALALIVMGVFMVNAEEGYVHEASMPLPVEAWSLLFYAAIGLVWGVYRAPSPMLDRALRLAGVALFCVGTASAFGWLLAYYKIPEALLANVSTWGMGPIAAGFFIAFCFLVVGCFLDAIPAIVIVGTVLEPLAKSVDLHPVQFAIISIVSLAFGLVTPPYGLCLMIACSIAGVRLRYAIKDTAIMLIPMLLVLAALIIWPSVSLFLPRLIVPEMLK